MSIVQDLHYGLRTMRQHPGFTAVAALSLALGIGANTAIFSFMDAILMRALPVSNPESLVMLNFHSKDQPKVMKIIMGGGLRDPKTGYTSDIFPYAAFDLLRKNDAVFSSLFAYAGVELNGLNVMVHGQAALGDAEYVTGEFFSGLGVPPANGRLIDNNDDRPGTAPVAVLSYGYAQRRFGKAADAAGQSISINSVPFTVIGVAPEEFYGVNPATAPDMYLPMQTGPLLDQSMTFGAPPGKFTNQNFYWTQMMGRLRPGVSMAQAQAALAPPFQRFVESTASNAQERADLPQLLVREGAGGLDQLRRQYSKPLYVLMTLVGLILAIACANLANLLLARAVARRKEIAVRLGLGASRWRVIRQLLTESVLLAAFGGALGVLFAVWGIRSLTFLLANGRDNFTMHAELNWQVLGVTVALTVLTGLLFGLAPAIQATRVDIVPELKEVRGGAAPARSRFLRVSLSQMLVVAQISISLLMLVAAGLFVRTLTNLQAIDIGFRRENLLLFNVNARQAGITGPALAQFYEDLCQRFSVMPGVRSASLSNLPLVSGSGINLLVDVPGAPVGVPRVSSVLTVGPSFFSTMQIPILLGREIDGRDTPGAQPVAVVNELFVKTYFGGENPVGRHLRIKVAIPAPLLSDYEIVGVSKATRYVSLKLDPPAMVYLAYDQAAFPPIGQMVFELRTAGNPLAQVDTVRRIVAQADARVPVSKVKTQAAQIYQNISQELTFASLCTCFAILALVIASVGLYGTMAYAVARRTSEIGLRMALGAQRANVIGLVMREVLVMAAIGLAIGLPVAFGTSKYVESFLFKMKAHDPVAMAAAAAILLVSALAAGYAPARRASRTDPMAALRHE